MVATIPGTDDGEPWTVERFSFGTFTYESEAVWRHRDGVYQRQYRNVFSSLQEALHWISSVRNAWPSSVFDSEITLRGETRTVDVLAVLWFEEEDQEHAKHLYQEDKDRHEARNP